MRSFSGGESFSTSRSLPAAICLCALLAGCGGGGGGGATPRPAGDEVVFVSSRDGQFEIYIMNGDGTAQTRLTSNTTLDQDPAFSPDGSRVAQAGRTAVASTSTEIFIMSSDGSGRAQLTNNNFLDDKPTFSPDGSQIAFRSTRPDAAFGGFPNSDIYMMNADGTGEKRLTTTAGIDRDPAFAPDGTILFVQEAPGGIAGIFRISRMNRDGSGLTPLTAGPEDSRPASSADGRRVVFTSRRNGAIDIFAMNADGSQQTQLTNSAAIETAPVFSPDGQRIVFSAIQNGNSDIFVMNADGNNANAPVRLTTNIAVETFPNVH